VHGGPAGQARREYSPLLQYLINHGYAVLAVNHRGSNGYGRTFINADDGRHGREPVWDLVEAKKYLATLGYVDGGRVGVIGESFGGYMVLAALAFRPEAFDVGVDIFGISNFIRMQESIPPYWESLRKALYKEIGDPVKDREKLRAISPLFHADRIRVPLLVLQVANDPRVIKGESDDIVAAVRRNKGVAEYVVFPDEGHGFTKKENEVQAYRAVLDFLDRFMKRARN
jgi:dipeptidyl aminopeptidase/acylaminoacyl peptidase